MRNIMVQRSALKKLISGLCQLLLNISISHFLREGLRPVDYSIVIRTIVHYITIFGLVIMPIYLFSQLPIMHSVPFSQNCPKVSVLWIRLDFNKSPWVW